MYFPLETLDIKKIDFSPFIESKPQHFQFYYAPSPFTFRLAHTKKFLYVVMKLEIKNSLVNHMHGKPRKLLLCLEFS